MKICFDCAHILYSDIAVCPFCGADTEHNHEPREAYHMTPGTFLKDGRYIICRALGYGGFGVTYAAFDTVLQTRVAIKEYLPGQYSTRSPGTISISVFDNGNASDRFLKGLQSFVNEAQRLAKFNSVDSIVSTYDFFSENNTAYIVMEYLDGITLKEYLRTRDRLPFDDALAIMIPVLNTLSVVHREGIIHRDISPDNIFLTNDGKVKLLDFGAARYASANDGKSLSVILKPGFAPKEQYTTKGHQGPWSDVYAVGATMYRMLTGAVPDDALERDSNDTLKPPSKLGVDMPHNAEIALLNALNVNYECRTQSAEEFAYQLIGGEVSRMEDKKERKPWALPAWIYAVLAGVLGFGAILAVLLLTGVIRFEKDASIDLEGSDLVPVPNLIGMTEKQAAGKYRGWRLVTVGSDYSAEIPVGCIMAQDPSFTVMAAPGTPINVVVNKGLDLNDGTMPYLRGGVPEQAEERLKEYNVTVKYTFDETMIPGRIAASDPDYGARLTDGQDVTIYISIGAKLTGVEIEWEKNTINFREGQSGVALTYKLLPGNVDPDRVKVTWISADPDIASCVDGRISPFAAGDTEVTVIAQEQEPEGGFITVSDSRRIHVGSDLPELTPTPEPTAVPTEAPIPTETEQGARETETHSPHTIDPTETPEGFGSFDDADFERAFRETYGIKGAIGEETLDSYTELNLSGMRIKNISDLRRFKNLTGLMLTGNKIKDIGPVSGLTGLTTLVLMDNDISDIGALRGLDKLTYLDLRGNAVKDVSPLGGLTELNYLLLGDNDISDVSPLGGLTNLRHLDLANNGINGIDALSRLHGLQMLDIGGAGVTRIEALGEMKDMIKLYINGCRIEEIEPIKGMNALRVLDLRDTGLGADRVEELRRALPDCWIMD